MIIVAKYASFCSCCNSAIVAGSKIEWAKGAKPVHAACAGKTVAATTSYRSTARRARPGVWTGCSCGSRDGYPSSRDCASCRFDA